MEKKKATQSELKWCRTGKWRAASGWRAISLRRWTFVRRSKEHQWK